MEKNKFWYPYMTAKSIIQSLGRSIRNEKDHASYELLFPDHDVRMPEGGTTGPSSLQSLRHHQAVGMDPSLRYNWQ